MGGRRAAERPAAHSNATAHHPVPHFAPPPTRNNTHHHHHCHRHHDCAKSALEAYRARVAEEGEYDDEELPPDVVDAAGADAAKAHFAVSCRRGREWEGVQREGEGLGCVRLVLVCVRGARCWPAAVREVCVRSLVPKGRAEPVSSSAPFEQTNKHTRQTGVPGALRARARAGAALLPAARRGAAVAGAHAAAARGRRAAVPRLRQGAPV